MDPAAQQPPSAGDRLERFRRLRARLDPAADPGQTLVDGLYIRPPRSVSSRIAAESALAPASTHVLIGGVGSGKTTELLAAQRQLNEIGDMFALYIDVSSQHDIGRIIPGVVIVQVGLELGQLLQLPGGEQLKEVKQAVERLDVLGKGYWDSGLHPDELPDPSFRVAGILISPNGFETNVREALEPTKLLLDAARTKFSSHMVVFLDGLDRMTDMAAFEQVVEHDIKALASIGVGVVLAGPLKALYGIEHTIAQRFDSLHYQSWVDVSSNHEDSFLSEVLRKRVPGDAMDDQGIHALVHYSGGVLRDLLALAQLACVEAYLDGSDVISVIQVDSAIDSFGRKHMQGLRSGEIEVLQRVRTTGSFVQTSEDDLALLMTRRVLEYRTNGRPRYRIHPTIERFLSDMAGEQR